MEEGGEHSPVGAALVLVAALAAQADVLELVLVEGESLGQVEGTLKRVSWAAQEVVVGAVVGLA